MDSIIKIEYLNDYFFDKIKEYIWILQFVSKNFYLKIKKYKFKKQDILNIISINKKILKWSINNLNFKINRDIEIISIQNHNLKLIKYLKKTNYNFDEKSFIIAIIKNDIEIIKYFDKLNIPCSSEGSIKASENGNLNILKYLHYNDYSINYTKCFSKALYNGHTNIILYIENYLNFDLILNQMSWQICCCRGYLDILKIFIKYFKNKFSIYYSIYNALVCNQNHIIKYIYDIDKFKFVDMINTNNNSNKLKEIACYNKNYEIIKFL